jgi:hypothetical protein
MSGTFKLKEICPDSFRETAQWLKFPLNGLRAQSRVSPVVGLLPLASGTACLGIYSSETWTIKVRDTRRITTAEMKYMRSTAECTWADYKTNTQIAKGVENNTNFGQITGIQEKLNTTYT